MEKFMQRENVFFGHGRGASNSDNNMDFNDVFGGPPRRYSMQEVRTRYSFGEPVESELERDKPAAWSGLKEKPVFGEETNPRRKHNQGDDFFDDIFKGGESYGSPRRSDRDRDRNDMFGLSPGSRIMSPLPPPSHDPIASHSIPPHLSLPAKLSKSVDLPTFGSQYSSTNGFNSPHSSSPLSRLSSRAIGSHEDDHRMGDEAHPSPLSRGSSFIFDEDFPSTDQKNSSDKLSKDMRNVDNIFNHFHFSIYKWAGRGVPMLMPLVGGNSLTSKGRMKYDKCASSNGRMERTLSGFKKQSEPEALTTIRQHMDDTSFVLYGVGESVVEEQVNKKMDESNAKKESSVKKSEYFNSQMKTPLHAFLNKGDDDHQETEDEKPKIHDRKRDKEREGIGIDSNNGKVERDVAKSLGVSELNKSASKGKVKEFVQIFNQEPDGVQTNASSRRRNIGDSEKKAAKDKEQVNLHNVDNKPDASFKAVENPNNHEARQYSSTNTPSTDHSSTNQKTTFPPEMEHRFSVDSALEVNFMVEELFDTHETVSDNKSSNDTKAIDAKIRQWAVGKTGNIRSLLSTLQHVLWADSGWKPVPLVDLIEANAVKRAYQKALLRLHPDKLQQKGADIQHKYTAEKVFDILQEAWDHFNTCAMTV